MSVRYVIFDGEMVSFEQGVFFNDARRDGVIFSIREGHRTFARQAYFWSGSPSNPRRTWYGNLAAFPSNSAPHIRTGRIDHADDLSNAQGIINYGARHGVRIYRTVRGEEWHVEFNAADLAAYAKRHGNPLAFMKKDEQRWVREYVRLKRANKNIERRRVLRSRMTKRRKEIWRAAEGRLPGAKPGWRTLQRRRRYQMLSRYT